MYIDGRRIAEEIQGNLKERAAHARAPISLAIVSTGDDPATMRFMAAKKSFGIAAGVSVVTLKVDLKESTEDIIRRVKHLSQSHRAIIIQLPLPAHINTDMALSAIPARADVDVLSSATKRDVKNGISPFVPPVLGAIQKILATAHVSLLGKRIAVVGQGRLVGIPVSEWLAQKGIAHSAIKEDTSHAADIIAHADIVITGIGVPRFITPNMVKEGVVLIDAGTSEEKQEKGFVQKIAGDCDPACGEKASVFTPVPGGVGPVAVAVLFENIFRAHGA
ncbi:MAG: bifunctional 5,10-methylenetetrahydrofolate dehydrogenase/5,10-methenyltetrahydrofolate cyclohydrolase [Patescibacteria group bacterium]